MKCEDCTEWEYFDGYGYGCFCMKTMTPIDADKCEFYTDKRNDVPHSVTHKEPKTGHWITENMSDGDVGYRCSVCKELFWLECGTPKDNKYNFCPKCGERLIEPQESEG